MSSPLILTNQFGEESVNNVQGLLLAGAGAPVDGTTGAKVSPIGGLYIDTTNGALYQNTGTMSSPAWTSPGSAYLTQTLAGFSAGAGTVSSADTILHAFNKLVGNTQNLTVTGNLLTGLGAGSNTAIASSDSILAAMAKLQAQITALS